jgi:hypothetical protein
MLIARSASIATAPMKRSIARSVDSKGPSAWSVQEKDKA